MRKVFIPFPSSKKIGGPQTFMANLKRQLDKAEYKYAKSPYFARSIFFPIATSRRKIKLVKLTGGKVIQRLDGLHSEFGHGPDYRRMNESIQYIYQRYSDHVVFQSQHCKELVTDYFGEKTGLGTSLIYNGANTEVFCPSERIKLQSKIRFITTGSIRYPVMIEPMLSALDVLYDRGLDFELIILGPIKLPNKDEITARKYVINAQTTEQGEIADQLRRADIFLYTFYNAPCPNSVIEAISCGLPIVGYETGSMPELCFFNKELLAHVNDSFFHDYNVYDYEPILEKVELLIGNFDYFKSKSLANSKHFSIEKCVQQYIDVFESVR